MAGAEKDHGKLRLRKVGLGCYFLVRMLYLLAPWFPIFKQETIIPTSGVIFEIKRRERTLKWYEFKAGFLNLSTTDIFG